MEQQGVTSKVEEPTEWRAPMVVVPKRTGTSRVRICTDLTELNKSMMREKHPLPSVKHTLGQLAGAKVFSKLDANAGFWQIPLSKESSLLTTFINPFGWYCYNRLCFGISSAPEHFQKRMSRILEGLEGGEPHRLSTTRDCGTPCHICRRQESHSMTNVSSQRTG